MAKELIINASLPEIRIALMEDGRIQELLIERQSDKGIVGNIYKGRVTRVLPGMQAAFVDVGLDKAAFLYVDDIYVHPKVMGDETEVVDHDHDHEHHHDEEEAEFRDASSGENSEEQSIETLEARGQSEEQDLKDAQAFLDEEEDEEEEEGGSSQSSQQVRGTHEESSPESEASEEEDEEDDEDLEDEEEDGDESNEDSADESSDGEAASDSETAPVAAKAEGRFVAAPRAADESSENAENAEPALNEDGTPVEASSESAAGGLEGLANQKGGFKGQGRGRNRKRGKGKQAARGEPRANQFAGGEIEGGAVNDPNLPDNFNDSMNDGGNVESDRAQMEGESKNMSAQKSTRKNRPEFKEQRGRDRRIKSKHSRPRAQANIADLLQEGQEVIVQVAKDPIATKGARLTCHVSLPGRHLVCMPSIDHVGVSRRIERDDERRRLRDFVEKNRPRKMGFNVRTASGGKDPESWIKQDIDYLSKLWGEIRNKADEVSAPALVYEDLNSILRAIRDWVNEDIDKIIVDTRYHYNELMAFADRFMPALREKIELYHGDIPVFDAYGLSSELYRSLERRVWLKSGGYIVIDQAEALVAIDVNTGRYVGKKSLEDTILKTNIEAAEEIAYQLRLRNCGGIIICDFIDMERDDNRMRVYRALDEALKKDRARPTIQKISELGLVEMTRKRTRDTIIRTLCEPCVHCEGKGFTKSTNTVAYEILREIERLSVDRDAKKILVSAHENVINILAIELRDAVDQLERRYNKTVYLQTVLDSHAEQFEVVTDRNQGKKQTVDIARQLRAERERSERKEKTKARGKQDQNQRNFEPREPNNNENQNNNNRNNRNVRNDRNDRNERPDREEQNGAVENDESDVQAVDAAPPVPVVRPAGSFVTARANPPAQPKLITPKENNESGEEEGAEVAVASGESDSLDEDAQPSFDQPQAPTRPRTPPADMDDEDQLAYLRAQAAQDAAIAGLKNPGGPAQANRPARGQNQNNRNNRNPNFRGGGGGGGGSSQNNNNGRNNRGGPSRSGQQANPRFRPQNRSQGNVGTPGNSISQVKEPQPETHVASVDYNIAQDDGSNS